MSQTRCVSMLIAVDLSMLRPLTVQRWGFKQQQAAAAEFIFRYFCSVYVGLANCKKKKNF